MNIDCVPYARHSSSYDRGVCVCVSGVGSGGGNPSTRPSADGMGVSLNLSLSRVRVTVGGGRGTTPKGKKSKASFGLIKINISLQALRSPKLPAKYPRQPRTDGQTSKTLPLATCVARKR